MVLEPEQQPPYPHPNAGNPSVVGVQWGMSNFNLNTSRDRELTNSPNSFSVPVRKSQICLLELS